MDKELAQQKIAELVETFYENQNHYESSEYNETQCREDFVDALFAALGWDIDNKEKLPPSHRAVRLEKRITRDGTSRAPDYSFCIGKERIFFVEAKKPSVHLHDGKPASDAALQLRRYGWSAGLPISILTNFKEFAVYDCTRKPDEKDKESTARLKYLTLDNYAPTKRLLYEPQNDFAYLWETFSYVNIQEKVRRGDFERAISTAKGILAVDDAFLQFLEEWRLKFATAIFKTNKDLTEPNLNVAVQQILDRIVFLRFAEDRGIELFKSVEQAVNTHAAGRAYQNLYGLFEQADNKYNSGLFDMKKEDICRNLVIDNKLLKDFVRQLYFPGPYDFQAMPVEILGSAYERFLGKTIKIDSGGKSVSVGVKPEVRKAGGVYYTPQYIVDYIVENTVGKLLEEKTPKEAAKIKIVDPACGSGSFLLGAYQFLLDWHRNYYVEHCPPSRGRKDDPLTLEGQLTIEEKKNILQNNIFGVDLDAIAVEFTKLSLLLKCAEGEDETTIQRLKLYHKRLLPNIDGNICCGNSLIGTDMYTGATGSNFSEKEQFKINAFDWHREFADIMKHGGFDLVIGNPPYGGALLDAEREYLDRQFNTGTTDTAALFLLKAQKLLQSDGKTGFIIPKAFTYASNWQKIREKLLPDITNIADCGRVWNIVKLEMSICILQRNNDSKTFIYAKRNNENVIEKLGVQRRSLCKEFGLILNGLTKQEITIGLKIKRNSNTLNDVIENRRGAMLQGNVSKHGNLSVLGGKQVSRYYLETETEKVKGKIFTKYVTDEKAWVVENSILVQNIVAHIANPSPHILITACLSSELANPKKFVLLDTINQLTVKDKHESRFVLALLNSRLLSWYVYRFVFAHAIRTMHFDSTTTTKIPFPNVDRANKENKTKYDEIVRLVDRMLALKKKQTNLEIMSHNVYHRQMVAVDAEIDALVYELYGLTAEDIAIIEGQQ